MVKLTHRNNFVAYQMEVIPKMKLAPSFVNRSSQRIQATATKNGTISNWIAEYDILAILNTIIFFVRSENDKPSVMETYLIRTSEGGMESAAMQRAAGDRSLESAPIRREVRSPKDMEDGATRSCIKVRIMDSIMSHANAIVDRITK